MTHKSQILEQALQNARDNPLTLRKMVPGNTKLGPCFQGKGMWAAASWNMPVPIDPMYLGKFKTLSEKYKHLDYVPLDIPRIELDDYEEFLHIWNKEKIILKPKDQEDHESSLYGLHITSNALLDFNLHDLYVNGRPPANMMSTEAGWNQGRTAEGLHTKKLFKHKFWSNLIVQIMDSFPIHALSNILIVEVVKDLMPHQEQSWDWNCPTEFRVALHDENTEPTLYVTDIKTGNTTYVNLPKDTNSVCWSNGKKLYGIDYHGKPNYQVIVNAVWNSSKVEQLIDRSIRKYNL